MSDFELQTKSLSEQVYEYLTNRIIEGTLEYGANLNIKELAADLHISTMPVREAIKRLEIEGVVIVHPRSRCVLRVPTKESILAAVEMRRVIESYCIDHVLSSPVEPDLSALRGLLDRMSEAMRVQEESERIRGYIALDRRYHSEICRLSGNQYAVKFHRELNLHLNMSFIYGLGYPPSLSETYEDHSLIVDHLSRRETEAARVLERHLAASRRNIVGGSVFRSLQ